MKKSLALTILLTLAMTVGLNLTLAKNNDNQSLQKIRNSNNQQKHDSRRLHTVKSQKIKKHNVNKA